MIWVYGILGFIILVFFHELGHFLAAIAYGIKVEEFAVGMGPVLLQKEFKGTLYKLCLIPLGGYCKIKGQEDFGSVERSTDKDSFFGKSPLARFVVVAAGPLFSFILGYCLLSLTFMINGESHFKYTYMEPSPYSKYFKAKDQLISINGQKIKYWDEIGSVFLKNIGNPNKVVVKRNNKLVHIDNYDFNPSATDPLKSDFLFYYKDGPTLITGVKENSPADKAGLKKGDIVASINGQPVRSILDILKGIKESPQKTVLLIKRYKDIVKKTMKDKNFFDHPSKDYETLSLTIIPEMIKKKKMIGITGFFTLEGPEIEKNHIHKNISILQSFSLGFDKSYEVVYTNAKAIVKLFEGNKTVSHSLSGPIKIFYQVGKISESGGITTFLYIIGVISLALGFFNLIPFPALDGGHMLISVIEAIVRKPLNPKVLNAIQLVGILMLLTVFVLVSIRDVKDIFF